MKRTIQDYADIIHLPRPVSATHPPMSLRDRAGQFAPFSALAGLHAAANHAERRNDAHYEGHHSPPALDKAGKRR